MASVIYEVSTVTTMSWSGLSFDFDDQIVTDGVDNSGLERGTAGLNHDKYLFTDVELKVTESGYGAGFTAGDWLELYMLCEVLDQDGTNYEDGDDTIEPPAANYIGSFILNANASQTHILRQVPMPPLMVRFVVINKADLISDMDLNFRPYGYRTLE